MARGLEIQFPLIAKLRDKKKVRVETLAASGEWFRSHYKLTPATAVTATEDLPGGNKKSIWFDSRFYRANLLWEDGALRFRDIHLFNENLASFYETKPVTTNDCRFFTLPLVDGYLWSTKDLLAGLRFKAVINGKDTLLKFGALKVSDKQPNKLIVDWPLESFKGTLHMVFTDQQVQISMLDHTNIKWYLELETAPGTTLPFQSIQPKMISAKFDGMSYQLSIIRGRAVKPEGSVFRLLPENNGLLLKM